MHEILQSSEGYLASVAPEVWKGDTATSKSDVYAYGILLWEMFTGKKPVLPVKSIEEIKKHVLGGGRFDLNALPSDFKQFSALIQKCWAAEPEQRPNWFDIQVDLQSATS